MTTEKKAITTVVAVMAVCVLIVAGAVLLPHRTGLGASSTPPPPVMTTPPEGDSSDNYEGASQVNESTPLTAVMDADEFEGFGELIFPSVERITDEMTIADIAGLLPYHSNVVPAEAADTVSEMLAAAREGEMTFHPIYSEEEIAEDRTKADVGLFFFHGQEGAPFSIISPGGGFSYVGSVHEGFPYAQQIADRGHHAFVLNYRTGDGGRSATEDLAAAIDYVFAYAAALEVDTGGYALWGSSAGARMAASLGSYGTATFGRAERPRPGAVIMAYTGHRRYTEDDPATFAVVGEEDGIASPTVMQERVEGLDRAGVSTEFQLYPAIGHGFGLGTGTVAEGWVEDAIAFWDAHRS